MRGLGSGRWCISGQELEKVEGRDTFFLLLSRCLVSVLNHSPHNELAVPVALHDAVLVSSVGFGAG